MKFSSYFVWIEEISSQMKEQTHAKKCVKVHDSLLFVKNNPSNCIFKKLCPC